ncbi:MAG: DNA replication/repair protein RecF [Anaerolineaceae bacterium]|nr:DNA replication/repair protein RecF [Anaerolineaceae bacterium]
MHVEHLSLTNFRNYARLELSLPVNRPIVLHGANAQGKTSLLEAIYYLAASQSPHASSDRQLINWRTEDEPLPFARLAAEVEGRGGSFNRIEMALVLDRAADGSQRFKKSIRINGVDKRVMDLVGLLAVVLFLPQDLSLIEGSPSERRRFMDSTLSQVDREYVQALTVYEKALPQRNALLKRISDGYASTDELSYWNDQLVTSGSVIIANRQRFLRELEMSAQQAHLDLTGKRETLTLRYQPNFLPTAEGDGQMSFDMFGLDLHRDLSAEQIAPQFEEQLVKEQAESIDRGMTLCGPHRDELRLNINGRDAGLYGSRGQARTAVMALKMAELTWMKDRIGEWPILLLDEVVAELDAHRRAYLLERINGATQTLLTTTDMDVFPNAFVERATIWEVSDGQIQTERANTINHSPTGRLRTDTES